MVNAGARVSFRVRLRVTVNARARVRVRVRVEANSMARVSFRLVQGLELGLG